MAKKPIRVSQLNAYIARLIAADGVLSDIAVAGEVSNFKRHGSGHVFFSLVDAASRVDCFLPGGIFNSLDFEIADGAEVVAEGYVNVYEKGGRYSLTIRRLIAEGSGNMAAAFEALKKKLAEKGYFDEERKRVLPAFPLKVAIVTSETGAAVQDIVKIITERNTVCDVLIFPTLVQGSEAAEMIAGQIRLVNASYADVDVMIVGRGGGSAEDLAAFNVEDVADAIFESGIPVISAVGHETDFTIADFVADKRAETPSAAAVLAVPCTRELSDDADALFAHVKGRLASIASRAELLLKANTLAALVSGLKSGISERGAHAEGLRRHIGMALREKSGRAAEADGLFALLRSAAAGKIVRAKYGINAQRDRLEALDPLRVLARGYAIVEDESGMAVTRACALSEGQKVRARFADGRAAATVGKIEVTEQ